MECMPHIRLSQEHQADYAILPGAPERIDAIASYLEDVEELAYNREFRSIRGTYRGVRVLAVSTGIGGPSTAIAVEELAKIGVKNMIRIGSAGALREGLEVGDLVCIQGAVRDDGTSRSYVEESYPAIPDYELLSACIASASEQKFRYHVGMARSHDMIYNDHKEEVYQYWGERNVYASDMETAALFVIGSLRHVHTASILNVVVACNHSMEHGINDYVRQKSLASEGETHEILTALEAVYRHQSQQ